MRPFNPVPKPVKKEKPKPKGINRRSTKRAKQEREYLKLRKVFLEQNPECEGKLEGCTGISSEVHHTHGKENKRLLEVEYFLPICRPCHTWITEHSKEAIEMGLSKSRLAK